MEDYRFEPPTLIEIRGRDRLKWLHSFVTNEVRDLTPGTWREAFATDAKGKTFSHGCICCFEERLLFLSLWPGQGPDLVAHWDRYIISEDVQLADLSAGRSWHAVTGSDVAQFCETAGVPLPGDAPEPAAGRAVRLEGDGLPFVVFGFAVPLQYALVTTAGEDRGDDATRTVRMLAAANRFPWFGIDFDRSNLPQEVARDHYAISFKKGCYLGQETVARLDALGQVQKQLFPVIINRDLAGAKDFAPQELIADGEPAGMLTSAYPSGGEHGVGFAMVRRKHLNRQDDFATADGTAVSLQSI